MSQRRAKQSHDKRWHKLNATQKSQLALIKEWKPDWGETSAIDFCEKYRYEQDALQEALNNLFLDERPGHSQADEQWTEVKTKKRSSVNKERNENQQSSNRTSSSTKDGSSRSKSHNPDDGSRASGGGGRGRSRGGRSGRTGGRGSGRVDRSGGRSAGSGRRNEDKSSWSRGSKPPASTAKVSQLTVTTMTAKESDRQSPIVQQLVPQRVVAAAPMQKSYAESLRPVAKVLSGPSVPVMNGTQSSVHVEQQQQSQQAAADSLQRMPRGVRGRGRGRGRGGRNSRAPSGGGAGNVASSSSELQSQESAMSRLPSSQPQTQQPQDLTTASPPQNQWNKVDSQSESVVQQSPPQQPPQQAPVEQQQQQPQAQQPPQAQQSQQQQFPSPQRSVQAANAPSFGGDALFGAISGNQNLGLGDLRSDAQQQPQQAQQQQQQPPQQAPSSQQAPPQQVQSQQTPQQQQQQQPQDKQVATQQSQQPAQSSNVMGSDGDAAKSQGMYMTPGMPHQQHPAAAMYDQQQMDSRFGYGQGMIQAGYGMPTFGAVPYDAQEYYDPNFMMNMQQPNANFRGNKGGNRGGRGGGNGGSSGNNNNNNNGNQGRFNNVGRGGRGPNGNSNNSNKGGRQNGQRQLKQQQSQQPDASQALSHQQQQQQQQQASQQQQSQQQQQQSAYPQPGAAYPHMNAMSYNQGMYTYANPYINPYYQNQFGPPGFNRNFAYQAPSGYANFSPQPYPGQASPTAAFEDQTGYDFSKQPAAYVDPSSAAPGVHPQQVSWYNAHPGASGAPSGVNVEDSGKDAAAAAAAAAASSKAPRSDYQVQQPHHQQANVVLNQQPPQQGNFPQFGFHHQMPQQQQQQQPYVGSSSTQQKQQSQQSTTPEWN